MNWAIQDVPLPARLRPPAPLSDEELRALWLRRVQTKPADFLRAKFAFQAQSQEGGAK